MSTSALIKDLLPPGPARAPVTLRKPEPKADGPDFGRVLEDSRQKTEPDEKSAKRDAPRQDRDATRREEGKSVSDRQVARDRPEHKDRPESGAKSASDRGENPPGLVKQDRESSSDATTATEDTADERSGAAKSEDKPSEASSAAEPTPPAVTGAPLLEAVPETVLTADLLSKLAEETVQPEATAATTIAATQDQVTGAAKPADTTDSITSATAVITVPVPTAPAVNVQPTVAEADQPLQSISAEKAAQVPASATNTLPTPEATKNKGESSEKADNSEEKAKAAAKPETPQTTHQTTPAAARELARVIEQLAEPNAPASGQPNAQTALLTTAADALASAKPQDPAHSLARADAPVPLQAIAVEIGMRAMRGSKEFSIRLDPEDLGRIDIKLEISEAGQVQAKLVVERVETLQLLQRDAKTLERAFDQAGLKTNPDGLQFSLRDPGQQGRQNGQQQGQPVFGTKDKDSAMINEITLRPVTYRTAATGGLDIRI